MLILAGLVAGIIREALVVAYYGCIYRRRACLGSGVSLAMGFVDLLIISQMAWERQMGMAVAYVIGEAIGTYVSIRLSK